MTSTTLPGADFLRRRIEEQAAVPAPEICRQLRERCGLTVVDIATYVGVSDSAVRQWERGDRSPRGDVRRRYADALRILRESSDAGATIADAAA